MKRFAISVLKFFFFFSAAGIFVVSLYPIVSPRIGYDLDQLRGRRYVLLNEEDVAMESAFGEMLRGAAPLKILPVNKDFSIVIEKINVNAPIVANVSVSDEKEYKEALKMGVAHAKGSAPPGDGNTYLFAHSSLDFWQLGRYATIFNLLDKLEEGDRVFIFYQGERFEYRVSQSTVYKGFDA